MSKLIGSLALIAALGGCASSGIEADGKYPSLTFEVATDYLSAHRRAGEYLRVCYTKGPHRYNVRYDASGMIDDRGTTGTMKLFEHQEARRALETIMTVPAATPGKANVTVTVLGRGRWNQQELDAAKRSIQSATPSCTGDD